MEINQNIRGDKYGDKVWIFDEIFMEIKSRFQRKNLSNQGNFYKNELEITVQIKENIQ